MFLSETWSDREQMVSIKERLDFGDLFIVPNEGRGRWIGFALES